MEDTTFLFNKASGESSPVLEKWEWMTKFTGIEGTIETPSDEYTNQRKAQRLARKDELLKMIQEAS
ncbi:MAG: hypothetical protein QNL68_02375 [Akkermansiaceae bacterium]|jgi:uncharacterized protein YdcH (DUF465 family)